MISPKKKHHSILALWHYVLLHSAIAAVTHFHQKPFKVRRHQIMRMMERAAVEKHLFKARPAVK